MWTCCVLFVLLVQLCVLECRADAKNDSCASGDPTATLQILSSRSTTGTTTTTTTAPNECPNEIWASSLCVSVADVTGPQAALFVPVSSSESETGSQIWNLMQKVIFEYYSQNSLAQRQDDLQVQVRVNNMVITETGFPSFMQNMRNKGNEGRPRIHASVMIAAEQGLAKDLVAYNRGLHLTAPQYDTLSSNMRRLGISDKSQLSTADANEVSRGLSADILPSVRSSIQRQTTTTTTTPVNPFSEGDRNRMEQLQRRQDAAQAEALRLRENLETATRQINADNQRTADEKATAIAEALADFSAESADLDARMKQGSQELDNLLNKRGGTADLSLEDLPVQQLIDQLALLRGVVVSPVTTADTLSNTVAEWSGQYRTNGVEQYRHAILTKSDQLDYEVSFSFSEASAASSASKIMSSLGNSAASAFSTRASAAGFVGGGIGSGAVDTAHTFGSATRAKENEQQSFSTEMANFYKQRYLVAPLYGVQIDANFLEPTQHLREELEVLKSVCPVPDDCEGISVGSWSTPCRQQLQRLFDLFGTHLCPDVTVGGYYASYAEVHSISEMTAVTMDNIASEATSEATSVTANVGFVGPFVAGSISSGFSNQINSDKAEGSRDDSKSKSEQFTSQVSFQSRGGQAGLGPEEWRRSLASNRNWAVTDRNIERCIPLWNWLVENKTMWAELSRYAMLSQAQARDLNITMTNTHATYCTMQSMYTHYVTTYLPYIRWVPKSVLDFTEINPYLVGSGGFSDGSASCGQVTGGFQEQSRSCRDGAKCLMKGMKVPVDDSGSLEVFLSSIGCVFQQCCFPLEASLGFGDKGCSALAYASTLSPDDLCKTGKCDQGETLEGVCRCPLGYYFNAFTLTCQEDAPPTTPKPRCMDDAQGGAEGCRCQNALDGTCDGSLVCARVGSIGYQCCSETMLNDRSGQRWCAGTDFGACRDGNNDNCPGDLVCGRTSRLSRVWPTYACCSNSIVTDGVWHCYEFS